MRESTVAVMRKEMMENILFHVSEKRLPEIAASHLVRKRSESV